MLYIETITTLRALKQWARGDVRYSNHNPGCQNWLADELGNRFIPAFRELLP